MLGLDSLARLVYTIQLNSTKRNTFRTAESATRESLSGSLAFMFLVLEMNLAYRIPFVSDSVGSDREQSVFALGLIFLLVSSGLVYYAIHRRYSDDRLDKICKSKRPLDLSTAKVLYAVWFVFYILFILTAGFMTIFSGL